jgi:hypothetical protein
MLLKKLAIAAGTGFASKPAQMRRKRPTCSAPPARRLPLR